MAFQETFDGKKRVRKNIDMSQFKSFGKGSKPRTVPNKRYRDEWEHIFKSSDKKNKRAKAIQPAVDTKIDVIPESV